MVAGINRLLSYLDEHQVHYDLIPHQQDFSAQKTAADTHTPGREFAKAVVLAVPARGGRRGAGMAGREQHVLVIVPADRKVDFVRAGEHFGGRVRLAEEHELVELFPDCEVGAEPPFGNLYDLPVYVSPEIADDQFITFNAGTHQDAVRMAYADFERLVKPTVLDLTWHPH